MHTPCAYHVYSLQERYLAGRGQRLRAILAEASTVADAVAVTRHQSSGCSSALPEPVAAAWCMGEPFSLDVGGFIKALDERYINCMQETAANVSVIFLQVRH